MTLSDASWDCCDLIVRKNEPAKFSREGVLGDGGHVVSLESHHL